MSDVYIIGTNHPYQILDERSTAVDANAYRQLLQDACVRWQVRGLAEEMSDEGLKGGISLAEEVAQDLGLSYRACDPDSAERDRLGVLNEGEVKIHAFLSGLDEDKLSEAIRLEYGKREEYWLRQLRELDIWPVLFICGANHVCSFEALLSNSGVDAGILERDWSP